MEKPNKYLVILVIVTGLIGLHFILTAREILNSNNLLYAALGVGIVSILSSYIAEKIVWVWDKISLVLGTVNSKILLSLIFYVFLFPIAIFSRLFKKKDALILKKKPSGSYYKNRNHLYTKEDLGQVF